MRLLVTGASGMVGKQVCQRLLRDGFELRMVVRALLPAFHSKDQVIVGAIDEATDWHGAVTNVQVVIHLAARVHVMNDHAHDALGEFRHVNTQGTLNLARQAAHAGVKRLVFISSVKVNGEATQMGNAFTELDAPSPLDAYGQSKFEAEEGLRQIAMESGMDVVVIRPPLVYGPGVKANFAALMHAVRMGWPLPLGSVQNKRSLIALDNLVDFIALCVAHPQAANQTFLISDGQDLSTAELIRVLAYSIGKTDRLMPVPLWVLRAAGVLLGKNEQVRRLCGNLQVDCSKARTLLNWRPIVTVEEGLRKAILGLS